MELNAKIAGIKAEAIGIKQTNQAELTAASLKNEQKIKKIQAMEQVYAQSALHDSVKDLLLEKECKGVDPRQINEVSLGHGTQLVNPAE